MLRGRLLGCADFRQFERSADDGERSTAVDDGPHADRLVDIRADPELPGGPRGIVGSGGGSDARNAQQSRGSQPAASLKPFAAAQFTQMAIQSFLHGIKHRILPRIKTEMKPDHTAAGLGCGMTPGLRFSKIHYPGV